MRYRGMLAFLFFLSGFAALVIEVLFSRLLQFSFGVTMYAVTAVLAAVMAGLALGAFFFSAPARSARRPFMAFGVLMLGVGVFVPAFPSLAKALTPALASLFTGLEPESPAFALARFAAAFSLLIIPSFLLGGTFPFVIRSAVAEEGPQGSSQAGFFYGMNTLGAALGALAAGYWLIPSFGYGGAVLLSSGLSICVGLAAVALGLREDLPGSFPDPEDSQGMLLLFPEKSHLERGLERPLVMAAVFMGGLIALSCQIIWTRVLINVFGGSVYSFSLVLTLFLTGLALGSWILPCLISRMREPLFALALLLTLAAAASALGILIFRACLGLAGPLGAADNLLPRPGSSFGSTLLRNAGLAGAVLLPSAFFLGGLLPTACGLWARRGETARFFGRLYALSALGSIAGVLLGGFLFLPLLSSEGGLVAGMVLCLVTGGLLYLAPGPRNERIAKRTAAVCGAAVFCAVALFIRPGGREESEILFFEEGPAATAKVESLSNEKNKNLSLRINGTQVTTTGFLDRRRHLLFGYFSTFCHAKPNLILSIGLGTGMSSGALGMQGAIRFEIAEVSHAVIQAAGCFSKFNHDVCDGGARIIHADGRNHLLLTQEGFDLITADPVHPWVAGSGNLYTLEYFELARFRLNERGVMSQWVPLYQLSEDNVRSVLATFHTVFPQIRVFLLGSDLAVIGSSSPFLIDPADWRSRIAKSGVAHDLASIGIENLEDLLACFLFAEEGLEAFLKEGTPVIRDADQVLEYTAPFSLWKPYDPGMIRKLLKCSEKIYALAPSATRASWPRGIEMAVARKREHYFKAVVAFYEQMSQGAADAPERLEEKIEKL